MSFQSNLYIHSQNQELLWNTISKAPLFQIINPAYREQWFKNIIQYFYDKNPLVRDTNSLQTINKDTIQYMINELKHIQQQKPQVQLPSVPSSLSQPVASLQTNSYSPLEPNYMGKSELMERKQELSNNAFTQRQKEYEKMFEKPVIPEVNFKEKLDDEPISNIEELVEKHRREREHELTQYSPKIKIDNEIQPETIIKEIIPVGEPDKKVRWVDEELYNNLKKEMDELKKEMNILQIKLSMIENNKI